MAPRKVDYALAVRTAITAFAEAAERIEELDEIYRDSEYVPGEADEITAEDLEGHDITVTNLLNASTFAENLALFLGDDVPNQFDYLSAINKFRNM